MNQVYAGMATIIAGIITAIVHIFITVKAKRSAERIASNNLKQQELQFEKSKKLDYLIGKKAFLESKVNDIYNIQDSIKFEKGDDLWLTVQHLMF